MEAPARSVHAADTYLRTVGGVAFYGTTGSLHSALSNLGQSGTVYDIATGMLGSAGGILAIVGVVACPITSGDTAFRSEYDLHPGRGRGNGTK